MYGYGCFVSANGKLQSGVALTSRTAAFKTATGITDETILNALNTFDLGLISNGLDSKVLMFHPYIGGTSTTCSYNFMNTSQYQINWYGGITFDSNGIQANGTNGYGQPSGANLYNLYTYSTDIVLGMNSKTDLNGSYCDISASRNGTYDGVELWARSGGLGYYSEFDSFLNNQGTVSSSIGTFISTRISGNKYLYKNGTQIATYASSVIPVTYETTALTYCASNRGSINFYSNRLYTCHFIGKSFSSTDVTNLTNLISNFNTALGR